MKILEAAIEKRVRAERDAEWLAAIDTIIAYHEEVYDNSPVVRNDLAVLVGELEGLKDHMTGD